MNTPHPPPSPSYDERERENRLFVWRLSRGALVALLAWFFVAQVVQERPWVLLSNVNLLFHEGGHAVFGVLGVRTLTVAGGTLMELLLPAAAGAYFWFRRRDLVATLVMGFWVGQVLLGVSRYMRDAVDMALPLVGGEGHDWNYLFTHLASLNAAVPTAKLTFAFGSLIELGCLAVLAWLAWSPREGMLEAETARAFGTR